MQSAVGDGQIFFAPELKGGIKEEIKRARDFVLKLQRNCNLMEKDNWRATNSSE